MRSAAVLLFVSLASVYGQDALSRGEQLYQKSAYEASIAAVGENAYASAAAAGIVGRDYYMLGDFKKASEAFRRALALEPSSSGLADWLARSFARRAETASPLTGPKYAAEARAYFEKAVALDPKSKDALNDLFDYYLEAPGFRGRGYNKAEAVAERIAAENPAEGQFAQARLAERRKDLDTAGEQLGRLIQATPPRLGRVLDVARNLAVHGRIPESEAEFDKAERLAPNSPQVELARARLYVQQKRNLDRAKVLLTKYLQRNPAPDDSSRAQAEELLKEASGA